MGAGALAICHNQAAVHIKEDMKRMVQLPLSRAKPASQGRKVFGVPLQELREAGLLKDGVPLPVRRMVEHLREHGLQQEGLFRVNGNARAVEGLKLEFESRGKVDLVREGDASAVASLLKQYLRELPGGLITATVQARLLQLQQDGEGDEIGAVREILQQLPDLHYSLLKYICLFLTQVESRHQDNRMTAPNLATVFGPNIFQVSPGQCGVTVQTLCNKIMVRLIQDYSTIFECEAPPESLREKSSDIITVEEAHGNRAELKSPALPEIKVPTPRRRKAALSSQAENEDSVVDSAAEIPTPAPRKLKACQSVNPEIPSESNSEFPNPAPRKKKARSSTSQSENLDPAEEIPTSMPKKKVRKTRSEEASRAAPQPIRSEGLPQLRVPAPAARIRHLTGVSHGDDVIAVGGTESLSSSPESDRPTSPFYLSTPLSTIYRTTDSSLLLEQTIRLAVEQHLFKPQAGSASARHSGLAEDSSIIDVTANQRRPRQKGQDVVQKCKDSCNRFYESKTQNVKRGSENMDPSAERRDLPGRDSGLILQSSAMKIQEISGSLESGRAPRMGDSERGCEEGPVRAQTTDWGEPVPADCSWQRNDLEDEEARPSPNVGGALIQQLLEEDSDPMPSPRSHGYGQQYLDDTEVPPSPPNAHSFMSRRRSSSLGSSDEGRMDLSASQLSKKIHNLKKKIHRFEEKFEEERKYRPSHSDKAANPEVLRWMNDLSHLRKQLKEHRILKSEEDLTPLSRPRSNTLPKSFGSQLEKEAKEEGGRRPAETLPPIERTLEAVLRKLQERREEQGRPEDIKDMTREQIAAEKVALQKALLYYENIHGRPVTKSEREAMKPLYDRYRLIKQILCRASTIPIIGYICIYCKASSSQLQSGSPSSKRRGLPLPPIMECEPALFFDDIKEEEEGSEDDSDSQTQFSGTFRPELSMLGFSLAIDELVPSKHNADTRLSNLHSASMPELVEQLQEAREEKKRLRKNLREFEEQFFRENGRSVQREDRSPLAQEYNEYKHIKAKLRLLEVLITKRDATKFI
ncbi:hypothetical protein GJAV_G00067730 [Gymnothorax javanicus]|nr:hypothetical protein GJAV_G00067730 [Gymnothorax javanicus]